MNALPIPILILVPRPFGGFLLAELLLDLRPALIVEHPLLLGAELLDLLALPGLGLHRSVRIGRDRARRLLGGPCFLFRAIGMAGGALRRIVDAAPFGLAGFAPGLVARLGGDLLKRI